MSPKAVIFDYIGTLVNCRNYSMTTSRQKLYNALVAEGFDVAKDRFLAAYIEAHEKYRKVRYEQFKEVTNAIWVSEALCSLGYKVTADDSHVRAALNVFFQDFIDTLELRDGAKQLLREVAEECKVGLISNFTHAPVIHRSLRKVGIDRYFNSIVVSDENGWRKPDRRIFQDALNRLRIEARDAVYVGDSPIEDIKGAKEAGLKTIFIPSQFNRLKDLKISKQTPDYIAKDLTIIPHALRTLS
ncbi:MAG: HAD family hydrolase [Candidatus Bathyarchaeota archaeon]|nr:HAD family hydrolase [Candidatus Bathyarchaeota archaeon]